MAEHGKEAFLPLRRFHEELALQLEPGVALLDPTSWTDPEDEFHRHAFPPQHMIEAQGAG
jgi:hypothetical protein